MMKLADPKEKDELVAKKDATVGKSKAELDTMIGKVLKKREDKKIADPVDLKRLKAKCVIPICTMIESINIAKGRVSGEEFGKLARQYINKDPAKYVKKLDSAGALDFMLKTTMLLQKEKM